MKILKKIFSIILSLIFIYVIIISILYLHNLYIIKKYNIISYDETNKKIDSKYFLINKSFSKNDALYDIRFLKKTILKIYPDPYFFISKEQFDNIFKQDEKEIEKLKKIDRISFFKIVNKTICSLKDVHASQWIMENMFFKYLYNYKKLFQAKVFIDNDNNVYLLDFVDDEQKKILIEKIASKENIKKDKINLKNYKIKIVSINGIKINDILDYLSDYENLYKKQMRIKSLNYDFIYKLYYLFRDIDFYNTKIYIEDLDLFFNLKIKSKNLRTNNNIYYPLYNFSKYNNSYKFNIFLNGFEHYYENKTLSMSINYDKKIAYLKINQFDFLNDELLFNSKILKGYVFNRFNKDYFKKYVYLNKDTYTAYKIVEHFNNFFKIIKENGIKYLIIDIKNNPGGFGFSCNFLIRTLFYKFNNDIKYNIDKKSIKNLSINFFNKNFLIFYFLCMNGKYKLYLINFLPYILYFNYLSDIEKWFTKNASKNLNYKNLKIFLIQNSNIFSAAKYFSYLFKKYNFGKIIGEETGEIIRGTANPNIFILPKTKLIYYLPFYIVQDENIFHGVLPDIEVHQTIDDLLKGKDTILEYTLNLIEKERE